MGEHRWEWDITVDLNFTMQMQLYMMQQAIAQVERDETAEDTFSWPSDNSGTYSAKSTYRRLCMGSAEFEPAGYIWKCWAPLKCKIFMWLAVQYRVWTSDRRARHGLQDQPSPCYTCLQEEDNVDHMLIQCVFSREVWFLLFEHYGIDGRPPSTHDTLVQWWRDSRGRINRQHRHGFDSLLLLTS